jgi:hypothetical protein
MNFFNILNINFTFVFPSCKCVWLHIIPRYIFFWEIFFDKKEFIFLNCEIVNFYNFFRLVLLQIHYESGAIRIRNDFPRIRIQIWILLKVV